MVTIFLAVACIIQSIIIIYIMIKGTKTLENLLKHHEKSMTALEVAQMKAVETVLQSSMIDPVLAKMIAEDIEVMTQRYLEDLSEDSQ